MSEQSKSEILNEPSPFPVTKEAVDRALAEIAQDAGKAMTEEVDIIQVQNPEVNLTLHSRLRGLGTDIRPYLEGALWTYRILRRQAEINGGQLPRISSDVGLAYLQDRMEELQTMGRGKSINDYHRELGERITLEEPGLGNALKEITKYRAGKESYYGGAADVYTVFKKVFDGRELQKKMGL